MPIQTYNPDPSAVACLRFVPPLGTKKFGALAPLSPKKQVYHFLGKNVVKIGNTLYFLKNVEIFLKTRYFHENSRGASLHNVENTLSKDVTRTKNFQVENLPPFRTLRPTAPPW